MERMTASDFLRYGELYSQILGLTRVEIETIIHSQSRDDIPKSAQ